MKKLTIILFCIFFSSGLVYNQQGNYFISNSLWEGQWWRQNVYRGSWFPTIDTVAHFAIDDYSWPIIRTKDDSIPLGTTFEINTTVYLNSGGVNIDGAFFGFGDQWMYYGGNYYGVWFGRYGTMNNQWRISFIENNQIKDSIGTYLAGETIIITLSLTQDGKLHVVSSKFNQYYTPTSTFTNRRFIIANSNCTSGHGFTVNYLNRTSTNFGLVAYYPFNGNANDESGNGNHGTTSGGISWVDDRDNNPSKACHFIDNSEIALPNNFNTASITVCAWNYPEQEGRDRVIFSIYNENSTLIKFHKAYKEGRVGAWYGKTGATNWAFNTDVGAVALNQWNFACLVIDSILDSAYIYIDGIKKARTKINGYTPVSLGNIIKTGFGKSYEVSNDNFIGTLDDIHIYNRALSEAEIQALYNEGGWAQGFGYIRGEIRNSQTLLPISNAVIRTNNGYWASTDTIGKFMLSAPKANGYNLDISAGGFLGKKINYVNASQSSTNLGIIDLEPINETDYDLIELSPNPNPETSTIEIGGTFTRYYQVLGKQYRMPIKGHL